MTCTACGDNPKMDRAFPSAVVEINNPEQLVLLRKVVMPATMTEEENPPVIGKYRNVILQYEDTGHIYLYSSDGIPTALEMNIPQEILDRIDDLETEDTVLHGEIESVASDLASEAQARDVADTALGTRIDSEITARTNADNALGLRLNTVETNLATETQTRQTADAGLQGQIDAITASSDVTDIVGTYAQLQAYDTSTLGNNDIIKVLQDESQNDETTYYRWSTTTQSFTLIGEEGPYYTKSQTDVLLNAKQGTLTAGTNIQIVNNTISATDTTYSPFTGTDGTTAGAAGLVPAPATTDAGKFLKADGTWDTAGGGSGPTVVQTTGTSTTDVMSQNAVSSMVFADPSTGTKVAIGKNSNVTNIASDGIAIGNNAAVSATSAVALGGSSANVSRASASGRGAIALGAGSNASSQGQIDVGSSAINYGYNNSNYRLLTGLYDPQTAHDAATKGYVDSTAPTITMTTTDPGEGVALAENNFIAVYNAS